MIDFDCRLELFFIDVQTCVESVIDCCELKIMPVYYTSITANNAFHQSDANGITGSCRLNQFCCGCSLRAGTKVVGSLSMVMLNLILFSSESCKLIYEIHS